MIIDAHQHLWRIGRNGHEWPTPDLNAIYRDYGPEDLRAEATGVDATILVQSQPCDADTDWMLEIADQTPLIAGVVGWADLSAPDAPARIGALAQAPKLKGLRPMLQGMADDAWILGDAVRPALRRMSDLGLSLDALIFTRHLPVIDQLARALPALKVVIDHCAKPPIGSGDIAAWQDALARVAQNTNVWCKLSGLATEMAPDQSIDAAAPCADHALDVFGSGRLMWGSDWPVLNLRRSYGDWLDWTKAWVSGQTAGVQNDILGGTASRFYRLT